MTKIILKNLPSGFGLKYEIEFKKGETKCELINCGKLDCKQCYINKRNLKGKIIDFYDVYDLLFG